MAQIGRWSGHIFEISPAAIKSFQELQIKAGSNTETKEQNSRQYLERKNRKPVEISLSVHLHAGLGYKVKAEADAFLASALEGDVTDYFYLGSSKLVPCRLMLTDATISGIEISAGGEWTAADVELSLKQGAQADGTQSGGGSGTGSKKRVKELPPLAKAVTPPAKMVAFDEQTQVTNAQASIRTLTAAARQTSANAKGGGSIPKTLVAIAR